jgi:hypothetical protein
VRWVASLTLALLLCGCGSAKPTPKPGTTAIPDGLPSLAVKCRETEPALTANVNAALADLSRHGLHGSKPELTLALEELLNYAATHGQAQPSCPTLLRAFLDTLERRPPPKAPKR